MSVRTLSMSDVRAVVDPDEVIKGIRIFDERGLMHLVRTPDKLYAEAQGSGSAPYRVAIAFGERDQLKGRCSCRAAWNRPFCKHSAALLVAWAKTPEAFTATETPREDEGRGRSGGGPRVRKGEGAPAEATEAGPAGDTGPRKRSRAAAPKPDSSTLMRTGAERVSTLVRELAVTGVGTIAGERVAQLEELSANLRQLQLRRLSAQTLDLALALKQPAALDALQHASLLADMLLTAAKITAHCDGKTLEDRYVEELIGKTWLKKDRRPVQGLRLVEYAYARYETPDQYRVCESRMIDLETGEHYTERQILPLHIAKSTTPKASYAGRVLEGAHGGIFPGFPPWRLYLEGETARREQVAADLERMLGHAQPIATAMAGFQEHRKDVFAPERLPALVRAEGLVAQGGRLRVFDDTGAALHLRHTAGLDDRMADALEARTLHAVVGELELHHAIPSLRAVALLVRDRSGPATSLRLQPVGAPRKRDKPPKPRPWAQVARDAGLSYAAVSLGEVREELAGLVVAGLAGLHARAAEPLVQRLQQLKLQKPAELLAELVAEPDPAQRVGAFVKLFQVLGVALVRLSGAPTLAREGLVPVPTHASILIPTPQSQPSPGEVMTARMRGEMSQYEAAVHYHRHYGGLAPARMEADLAVLADGGAMPYVVEALADPPARAVAVAERILSLPLGTVAQRTAFALLVRAASPEAELVLKAFSGRRRQEGRQHGQRVVHLADDALVELQRGRPRLSPLAESRRDHLAEKLGPLLSQARSDKDAHARELACEALANLGAQAAVPDLRTIFRTDKSKDVRRQAAISLGMLGDVRVVEELLAMLHDGADESMARAACRALGYLGDSRTLPVLVELYRKGFTPSVVAEAWLGFGVLALDPIADMIDADPALTKRSALAAPLAHMPLEWLVPRLLARLAAGRATPDLEDDTVVLRAIGYLKLCTDNPKARTELARRLLPVAATSTSAAGKRLRTTLQKLLPRE